MSAWPEYLDVLERWLEGVSAQLSHSRPSDSLTTPASPTAPAPDPRQRPDAPIPPELHLRALGLLATLERLGVAAEGRRDVLLGARSRLESRRRSGPRWRRIAVRL